MKNSFDHPLRWFDGLTTGFAQGRLSGALSSEEREEIVSEGHPFDALPIFHQRVGQRVAACAQYIQRWPHRQHGPHLLTTAVKPWAVDTIEGRI